VVKQIQTRSLFRISQQLPTVAILLIGLGLLAALRAGLVVNRAPIGAVDSGAFASASSAAEASSLVLPALLFKRLSEYLSATSRIPADKFVAVPAATATAQPTELPCANSRMMMGGWAADAQRSAPASRVELYIDRLHVADALLGIDRPDVEEYFQRADFAKSGWQLEIPLQTLSMGYHYMEIWAVDREGTGRLLLEHRFECLPPRL